MKYKLLTVLITMCSLAFGAQYYNIGWGTTPSRISPTNVNMYYTTGSTNGGLSLLEWVNYKMDAATTMVTKAYVDGGTNTLQGNLNTETAARVALNSAMTITNLVTVNSINDYASSNFKAGYNAGDAASGWGNVYIGYAAADGASGNGNMYLGYFVADAAAGNYNSYLGYNAAAQAVGNYNSYLGRDAGEDSTGDDNVFLGYNSGEELIGTNNVSLGIEAGKEARGNNNYFMGYRSGQGSKGVHSLFLGNYAGQYKTNDYNAYFGNFRTINANTARVVNATAGVDASDLVTIAQLTSATNNIGGASLIGLTNTWYVSKSGNDSNDGRTIGTPKLTWQAAITAAGAERLSSGQTQGVLVYPGTYTENIVVSNGVSIYGVAPRNTALNGTITMASDAHGAMLNDFTVIDTDGTIGTVFSMPYGLSTTHEVKMRNVIFLFVNASSIDYSLIKIQGGHFALEDCTIAMPSANFVAAEKSRNIINILSNANFTMRGCEFKLPDMAITNGDMTLVSCANTGDTIINNNIVDFNITNTFYGHATFMKCLTNANEISVDYNEIDIVGNDATAGEGEGFSIKFDANPRLLGNTVKISGFGTSYSYEGYNDAVLIVNAADDVATDGVKLNNSATLLYTGSPEDGVFQIDGLRWGTDGQLWAGMPESPSLVGHSGTSYWNFCAINKAVFGETEIYNNIFDWTSEDNIVDINSKYMSMTATFTGWDESDNDGEAAAGSLFPEDAVRSNFQTAINDTGTVVISGCEVGETYLFDVLASAANSGKGCTDMNFWTTDSDRTGTVVTVDNTDNLTRLTNVASATTITLYGTSPNAGEEAFINALRVLGPAGSGMLPTDGSGQMSGNLEMADNDINLGAGALNTTGSLKVVTFEDSINNHIAYYKGSHALVFAYNNIEAFRMDLDAKILKVEDDLEVKDFSSLDSARIGATLTDPGTGNLYVENDIVAVDAVYQDSLRGYKFDGNDFKVTTNGGSTWGTVTITY